MVSMQHSSSALQAAVDYVRTFGCSNDEITILGVDTVAWRGARFSAVLVPADPRRSNRTQRRGRRMRAKGSGLVLTMTRGRGRQDGRSGRVSATEVDDLLTAAGSFRCG